jgi:serine/threonine protein kinase
MEKKRDFHGWITIGPRLGEGGQSEVFLVRSPQQEQERQKELIDIQEGVDHGNLKKLGRALESFMGLDAPSELGALKVFKILPKGASLTPPPSYEPVERLRNEISVLSEGLPGFPKLLEASEDERWIVTEYFPERTLEHQPFKYRGQVLPALKAFRSLVRATSLLHARGFVHRDIKPANVFIRGDELVLGDFGIVYVPNTPERVTLPEERVGPRDYMPRWANLGTRDEVVHPNIDVFMLGKLLWSIVDGRDFLPYEYHRHPKYGFDLTQTFPNNPDMYLINQVLDRCVVEEESDCNTTSEELLGIVDAMVRATERGGQLLKEGVPRPCRICGIGFYQANMFPSTQPAIPKHGPVRLSFWFGTNEIATVPVYPFVCDYCGHVELFTRPSPGS